MIRSDSSQPADFLRKVLTPASADEVGHAGWTNTEFLPDKFMIEVRCSQPTRQNTGLNASGY